MYIYLPEPYPDELLYSVIARYLSKIDKKKILKQIRILFGRRILKPQIDLTGSTGSIAKATRLTWKMSAEEIVRKYTLFPYYSYYLKQDRSDRYLIYLQLHNQKSLIAVFGLSSSVIQVPGFLRICPVCVQNDVATYGETYWHRSHQLPGVLVCPEHSVPLQKTKALRHPLNTADYIEAHICSLDSPGKTGLNFTEKEIKLASLIARRCRDTLDGTIGRWQRLDIMKSYRIAILEREEFTNSYDMISWARLTSAFVDFYGEKLLNAMGCYSQFKSKCVLAKIINRRESKVLHPAMHALIQIFLEHLSEVPDRRRTIGYGPWRCPNIYANHDTSHPIEKIRIEKKRSGDPVAVAKCKCGFHFSFSKTTENDHSMPVIERRMALGPSWKKEVDRLRSIGFKGEEIQKRLNITAARLDKLMKSIFTHRICTYDPNKIFTMREEWLKIVQEEKGFYQRAIERNHSLYERLRVHDHDWLMSQPRMAKLKKEKRSRIDWEERDEAWSSMLQKAARTIIEMYPPKRATKSVTCIQAALPTSLLRKLKLLPRCQAVLSESSESIQDYQERKRKLATDRASKAGKVLRRANIGSRA